MPIAFAPDSDRLPPGRHEATVVEIEQLLVDDFPSSHNRRPLFESWRNVIAAMQRVIPIQAQWLDGSFVTTKEEPADIDIVTHFDGESLEGLDPVDQTLLRGLVGNAASQALHGCDSYVIAAYPAGHAARPAYEAALSYWDGWFGRARDGKPKGYVEVVLS